MEKLFRYRSPNVRRLLEYGFVKVGDGYLYTEDLKKCQMTLSVTVNGRNDVSTSIADSKTGDEYVLYRIEDAVGSFVGLVRSECERVLSDIADKCFDREIFASCGAKRIIEYSEAQYGSRPEFLWEKLPDCAVLRRNDNKKWFAVLMIIPKAKLGIDGEGTAEIANFRIDPEVMGDIVDNIGVFPAYHMNKKYWVSILCDGLQEETADRFVDESRANVKK